MMVTLLASLSVVGTVRAPGSEVVDPDVHPVDGPGSSGVRANVHEHRRALRFYYESQHGGKQR